MLNTWKWKSLITIFKTLTIIQGKHLLPLYLPKGTPLLEIILPFQASIFPKPFREEILVISIILAYDDGDDDSVNEANLE